MRTTQRLAPPDTQAQARLVLAHDERRRCRQRARLEGGEEVALLLPRGTILRAGDRLVTDDGLVIAVEAAPEQLSSVTTSDRLLLARAAYHLGNRHVPLQIEPERLCYRHDHVLDDLVASLGLVVTALDAPFEPESGAYQGHGHGHGHVHGHGDPGGPGHDHERG
jgi:urease accessory protein